MKDQALIFLLQYPERGKVKPRLAEILGDDFTLRVYSRFVLDLVETCDTVDADTLIAYSITPAMKGKKLFFDGEFKHFPQQGDDPGARMYNALATAKKQGYKKCILIGGDSPDLPAAMIEEGYEMLDENDMVLGPCVGGGVYLVGCTCEKIEKGVFDKVRWGTQHVMADTMKNIDKKGFSNYLLPEWDAIDDMVDLKRYFTRYRFHRNISNTMEFLLKNQELILKWFE